MSSIEEKLRSIREIVEKLDNFKKNISDHQNSISSQLSDLKGGLWNDMQMEYFSGREYIGKFYDNLAGITSKIEKTIAFLENKYSTLETHRN